MNEKRPREAIIKDILEMLILHSEGLKITYLMEKSNTSYNQLKEILKFMFNNNWIIKNNIRKIHLITEEGINAFIDLSISLRSLELICKKPTDSKEEE